MLSKAGSVDGVFRDGPVCQWVGSRDGSAESISELLLAAIMWASLLAEQRDTSELYYLLMICLRRRQRD